MRHEDILFINSFRSTRNILLPSTNARYANSICAHSSEST